MIVLNGPNEPVRSLVFAPDAARLYATLRHDTGVYVWDLADRTSNALAVQQGRVWGEFTVHPGGRWAFGIVSFPNNHAALIDLHNGRAETFRFMAQWGHVALSPDGTHLATVAAPLTKHTNASNRSLCGWEMATTGPELAWEQPIGPDEQCFQVAHAGSDAIVLLHTTLHGSGTVRVSAARLETRSATNGKALASARAPHLGIRDVVASPDGRLFVARTISAFWVYETRDLSRPVAVVGEPPATHVWRGTMACWRAAAFHPNGHHLLLATDGPSVTAFDTTTWQPVREWNWKVGAMDAVAVSPDGALAAAGGPSGTVVVWDWDL